MWWSFERPTGGGGFVVPSEDRGVRRVGGRGYNVLFLPNDRYRTTRGKGGFTFGQSMRPHHGKVSLQSLESFLSLTRLLRSQ